MATPPSMPEDFAPDTQAARPIIDAALADKRTWLDPVEMTKAVLGLWHCDYAGRAGAQSR